MKPKIVSVILLSLLLIPLGTYAQTNAHTDEDEAAVRQVVQHYIEGWINENIESLRDAFHPKAKLFSISDKYDLREDTLKDVASAFKDNRLRHVPRRSELGIDMNIVSMDVAGDAAFVKVETTYPQRDAAGFDYLSLKKFRQGWKIVSRVSSVNNHQGQPARS